jgi:hypothetical protein
MEDLNKSLLDEIEAAKKYQDEANTELEILRKKTEDVYRENQTLNAELGKQKLSAVAAEPVRVISDMGVPATRVDSSFEREVCERGERCISVIFSIGA